MNAAVETNEDWSEKDGADVSPFPVVSLVKEPAERDFATLFQSEHRKLYMLALRMVGESEAAEDIVQEGFLRAWRNWSQFRGDSTRASWVYGIVLRCALTSIRDSKRSRELVLRDEDVASNVPSYDPPTELGMDLETALTLLPQRARAVFVLRDIEGFPTNDVAELLLITPGAVKSHLFHARRRLAAQLSSYE